MSYIRAENPKEQKYFDFLEDLRQSGETNMFGSAPYLQAAFSLTTQKGVNIVTSWMKGHSDKGRILDGPLSKEKTTAVRHIEILVETKPRKEKTLMGKKIAKKSKKQPKPSPTPEPAPA